MLKWCIYTNLVVQILGCKKCQNECKEFVKTDTRSSNRDKCSVYILMLLIIRYVGHCTAVGVGDNKVRRYL